MSERPYALPVSLFPLADSLPAGLVLHRSDRILFANRAMSRLTGYSADELAQMDFWAFFPRAAQAKVQEWGRMRLQGEHPPARYETLIVVKSGEERWVELTLSCEAIDGARTVLCSYLDITDRKRAEAAQAQSRQLLAQIIDGDPVPTLVINARHIVTHWNQACEQITGIRAADIVGTRKHWTAFYDHERPIMADLIVTGEIETITKHYGQKKLRRSPVVGGAYEAEDFFPHFGENGRWLYFTAAPLRNAAGATIGAIETLQDITERRKAEDELRKMHTSLEAKVAQRTVELQDAKATLERDIARRKTAEAELRSRYTELQELNGRLSDTQQQLVQSEKMASIGQLAAGVAHEINNPIGYVNSNIRSLKGYIAQLLDVVDAYQAREAALPDADRAALAAVRKAADFDFLREDVTQLLAESEEGTERVRKIVQDLRDFSRTEATQDWQSVDLRRGLDSTLNIASNEIKYRAEVVREYGEIPLVECLPSQLNQVFMNLFVNAAQAMPEGQRGLITVRTGTEPSGEAVWIEVADNGSGMPADVVARIFDPFFTTKPVGKGTGLGLSLSYGIIQKHHGHIGATSTPGAGTTFRIVLPVHRALTDGAPS